MAVIKLTEISSFENNFKSQNIIQRINSLGITHIHNGSNYTTNLLVTEQKNTSIFLFENDGTFYDSSPSKELKDIKSFKDLNISTINGEVNYSPELAWIDTSCGDTAYIVDTKFNPYNNTQHIVKYDQTGQGGSKKNTFTLDDVIIQMDNQKICHFAVSESRTYDSGYGGYPLTFYIIDEKGTVLEFDTQNYRNKIIANPQSMVWKDSGFYKKEGFVRLIENSYYWGNKEELVYAFGLDTNNSSFFLELVNMNSLHPKMPSTYYSNPITAIQKVIGLNFSSHIDFNLNQLPKFDSASCFDDKEFIIAMTPVVHGVLNYSYRDLYWFRLQSGKDEAILLADPYRVSDIDRFDSMIGCESPVCIRRVKENQNLEDIIYLVTGQNEIKKFRIDLEP